MDRVAASVEQAIRDRVFPGAAFAFGRRETICSGTVGSVRYPEDSREVTSETIYDLASLTKVIGTTTLAMRLWERSRLSLDSEVRHFLPTFTANGKDSITIRHLLIHEAGLAAFRPYHLNCSNAEEVYRAIDQEELQYPIETKSVYSDLSMIVLQRVLETICGQTLDRELSLLFHTFGLADISYTPDSEKCAPTEPLEAWRKQRTQGVWTDVVTGEQWLQGQVHDPTAAAMGGVAGHAGLFASLTDLVKFVQLFLNGSIVEQNTIRTWTARQSPRSTRALGWDTKSETGSSAGSKFGPRSFGHTGFTGTSLWIDPESETWAILLSNRVHPTAENRKIIEFRPVFHDMVWASLQSS
jgi:CubicO group peptidase (beta-lactamase class C family)